ncbi:MAG TPA: thioredoxin [Planctomycetota bacterium]|nr:thioredoxin [Planctomycetota bacterium]
MVTQVGDPEFKSRVLEAPGPVLVDFFATWCGPCLALSPVIEEIAKEMAGRLTVVKVDIDESPDAASTHGVTSIPTLVLFKGGREAWRRVGAAPKRALSEELAKAV